MANIHKARNPDFWLPQRQPIGAVEIDWTHPLALGLVVAVPFCRGGDWSNLAAYGPGGYPPSTIVGSGVSIGSTPDGVGLLLPGGSGTQDLGVKMLSCPNSDAAMTVVVRGIAATSCYLAGEAGGSGDWNISNQGPFWRFEFTGGGNNQLFGATPSISPDTVGISVGAATGKIYVNGNLNGTAGPTSTGLGTSTTLRLGQRQDGFFAAGTLVSYLYKWSRQLSDAEQWIVATSPYCFLKPGG